MAFTWKKFGSCIFSADNQSDWMHSHIQNPCPIDMGDRIRVYFNTRPKPNKGLYTSHPTYIDLDRQSPNEVIGIASGPVLSSGDAGCFDQHGCMTSTVVREGNEIWMYYVGWSRTVGVPYNWSIGLATSTKEGVTFSKRFKGPIIGAQFNEPYLQNGCYVLQIGTVKHMWYSTGIDWFIVDGKYESRYVIVHATSSDGINWQRNGIPIISFLHDDETQTTPAVFYHEGKYHMLFSTRHSKNFRNKEFGYRLGYAWSKDLKSWHRDDESIGISVSDSGWDAEMVCYPQVIKIDHKILLFYCGNHFGMGGLSFAELEL